MSQIFHFLLQSRFCTWNEQKVVLTNNNGTFSFQAVVEWVKHDPDSRTDNLSDVLSHVRLPLVSPYFLFDVVEREPVLTQEVECRVLMDEAKKFFILKVPVFGLQKMYGCMNPLWIGGQGWTSKEWPPTQKSCYVHVMFVTWIDWVMSCIFFFNVMYLTNYAPNI